ncbi:hypothetical protein SBA6_170029 [Candidatus Sulfopaludibacter sp. SbA6]|nr:hypothetical protein SBA6_170029 [Candidatus Sulfopaludibacter sp. SbA6]
MGSDSRGLPGLAERPHQDPVYADLQARRRDFPPHANQYVDKFDIASMSKTKSAGEHLTGHHKDQDIHCPLLTIRFARRAWHHLAPPGNRRPADLR